MNNLYDEYLDMLMESENTDDEAKKKAEAKEKRKKYAKAIITITAAIAGIAATIAIVKKLIAKAPDKETKDSLEVMLEDIQDQEKEIKELFKKFKKVEQARDLSGGDLKLADNLLNQINEKLAEYTRSKEKVNLKADAMSKKLTHKFLRNDKLLGKDAEETAWKINDIKAALIGKTTDRSNKKLKALKDLDESANDVTYDNLVDAICEKYNDDQIDAETCIKLMERAAERYAVADTTYEDAGEVVESAYDKAVNLITEKFISDEIDEETCQALLERAVERYFDED